MKNLPKGSTPIDFAYSIHSAVGNKMVGARVNGKLVNIDYQIQNGDRVEVITSQNSKGPSRDWLSIVKSTQAKTKINQWFKSEFKEENIVKGRGRRSISTVRPRASTIPRSASLSIWNPSSADTGSGTGIPVLAAVGHGGLKEGQVVHRMLDEYQRDHKKKITDAKVLEAAGEANKDKEKLHIVKSKSGIVVRGIDDVAVRFSKCCSPVPGDEIVGFVTRGRGVSIHRTDCVNIIHLPAEERARLIEAEWQQPDNEDTGEKYEAEIKIYGNNRMGLLVRYFQDHDRAGH